MQWLAKCGRAVVLLPLVAAGVVVLLSGCDRVFEDSSKRSLETAEQKYAAGDYQGAVQYYEAALDDSSGAADIHYKLGLLFDDKLKNPLAATYHFQRYLDLKPAGSHAKEATAFMKDDQLKLATSLSHGAFMSQEDAARLKNDNLLLRQQLAELRASRAPSPRDSNSKAGGADAPPPAGSRTYEVQAGDTLASIARKFYKNSARWKDIEQANYSKLKGTAKLKPGMTLVIPK